MSDSYINYELIYELIDKRKAASHCGSFNHIACFIPKMKRRVPFTIIGINTDKPAKNYSGTCQVSTHAEIAAIERVQKYINKKNNRQQKMDLVVLRVNRQGELCNSAPCIHCTRAICDANAYLQINHLYYSTESQTLIKIRFRDWVQQNPGHISRAWRETYQLSTY